MSTQTEAELEETLITQLQSLGWKRVGIRNEAELVANLKTQLEIHNQTVFSQAEFEQILNKLKRGNLFEKSKTLREKMDYRRDDGKTGYLEFLNQIHWCKNQYQVTQQITMEGAYKNRYDVTLLVNGLPLVQIELKRRGLEMKEAFNQTNRYQRHSFSAGYGLFEYLQLFVISNGVNTKYYANNPVKNRDFKQTFYWTDADNQRISKLEDFATAFLETCTLSKMIAKYIVLHEGNKILMALRPYQFYAVERIVERVEKTQKNGYIRHTTGSGKTLTSFKAAQILTQSPNVHKVVFVVDRKDLDFQTANEFNSFSEGSVDTTTSTNKLVQQFADDTPLIVTTLQKLNTAIRQDRHLNTMQGLKNKPMVFIFDECHRSQFGETHQRISQFFENVQMFGFMGTPIFAKNAAKNALGKRTTKDLFGECLHQYLITDAINDENVLKFSVEYYRTFRQKEGGEDSQVEAIDTAGALKSAERLENIVDYILKNHSRKTHGKQFTAMMCVQNVETLAQYYTLFKQKKENGAHDLKIATIFSYQANPDDPEADGGGSDEMPDDSKPINPQNREFLDACIADYNQMFGTNYSTKDSKQFYAYYNNISKRVKAKEIDFLLVVNMFLTGFDSKALNTIYVDKNLQYHGLIQAYSRTNRTHGTNKSQGNVVVFRDLKSATDEAIELFASKDAQEDIILKPYEDYLADFETAAAHLRAIAPNVESVDALQSEEDQAAFIQSFRALLRIKNILVSFVQFDASELSIDEQTLADYQSKYLDLYDQVRSNSEKEKVSILNDLDFEIELISQDNINVGYILNLLQNMQGQNSEEREKTHKLILETLDSDTKLRSKKELIERFIAEHVTNYATDQPIKEAFDQYWDAQSRQAIEQISQEEGLNLEGFKALMAQYQYTNKPPVNTDITKIMDKKPSLRERKNITKRIIDKMKAFVETYIEGVD